MDLFKKAVLQTVVSDLISPKDVTEGRFNEDIDNLLQRMELEALKKKYRRQLALALSEQMKAAQVAKLTYDKSSYETLEYVIGRHGVDVQSSEEGDDSDAICTDSDAEVEDVDEEKQKEQSE